MKPGLGFGGSLPGLPALSGLDIIARVQEKVAEAVDKAKIVASAPPGSAWGSRIVPSNKRKYEMPEKIKPKVKEETKKSVT